MSTVVSQRLELLISAYAGEKVKRPPKTQERSYQGPDQSRPSVLRGIQWDSYHFISLHHHAIWILDYDISGHGENRRNVY